MYTLLQYIRYPPNNTPPPPIPTLQTSALDPTTSSPLFPRQACRAALKRVARGEDADCVASPRLARACVRAYRLEDDAIQARPEEPSNSAQHFPSPSPTITITITITIHPTNLTKPPIKPPLPSQNPSMHLTLLPTAKTPTVNLPTRHARFGLLGLLGLHLSATIVGSYATPSSPNNALEQRCWGNRAQLDAKRASSADR
ncbi:predicted protein [Plenodomus lingam JN3]|uniref:Predicted protein n=1 Tax=Leptosphaeria maculans (strain JN3 / isolate v23.1.3 / race Av1-4-5-6-7-8) TaxID=985895 RepID=E5A0X9_LEPMJ|nr:predicted protein [Plenodomus lingam JN3]CBX97275.1 predicted protein [Plenodomus lingam JN3]